MAKSNKTYDVGYKKPPKATRFPKGTSGNPGGKPKKVTPEFDLGKVLQSIDNEEIIIPIDAKINVKKPKMFAVTVEKPGGVVVSDRQKLVAIAKV